MPDTPLALASMEADGGDGRRAQLASMAGG